MIFLFSLLIATSPQIEKDSIRINLPKDPWFSEDKLHHFLHSAAISSSTYLISTNIGSIDKKNSLYISISIGTLAGITKEIHDKHKRDETFSVKDLIYDIAGVIAGILLVSIGGS